VVALEWPKNAVRNLLKGWPLNKDDLLEKFHCVNVLGYHNYATYQSNAPITSLVE
jgi:hypothetical protein